MDLFEWIEGEQLGSVEEGVNDEASVVETFSTIGELAARVHNQAVQWQLPEGFTRVEWDAEGLAGDNAFWGRFWELEAASDDERAMLRRVKDVVYQDLMAMPKSA